MSHSKSDINILLIGEKGVGKTTFINSFANYVKYKTFERASNAKNPICLIPTYVRILNDEGLTRRVVHIECNNNEYIENGFFPIQNAKSYIFPIEGHNGKVRLIDIEDSPPVENFALPYTICFLLKPNQDTQTNALTDTQAFLKKWVLRLLPILGMSGLENVIFVCTHSRPINFESNEKLMIQQFTLMLNPPYGTVNIPCNKDNTFYLDNEAFQFLVALRHKVLFSDYEKSLYSYSWDVSSKTCKQLVDFANGGNPINEAGTMPSVLATPIFLAYHFRNSMLRGNEGYGNYTNLKGTRANAPQMYGVNPFNSFQQLSSPEAFADIPSSGVYNLGNIHAFSMDTAEKLKRISSMQSDMLKRVIVPNLQNQFDQKKPVLITTKVRQCEPVDGQQTCSNNDARDNNEKNRTSEYSKNNTEGEISNPEETQQKCRINDISIPKGAIQHNDNEETNFASNIDINVQVKPEDSSEIESSNPERKQKCCNTPIIGDSLNEINQNVPSNLQNRTKKQSLETETQNDSESEDSGFTKEVQSSKYKDNGRTSATPHASGRQSVKSKTSKYKNASDAPRTNHKKHNRDSSKYENNEGDDSSPDDSLSDDSSSDDYSASKHGHLQSSKFENIKLRDSSDNKLPHEFSNERTTHLLHRRNKIRKSRKNQDDEEDELDEDEENEDGEVKEIEAILRPVSKISKFLWKIYTVGLVFANVCFTFIGWVQILKDAINGVREETLGLSLEN